MIILARNLSNRRHAFWALIAANLKNSVAATRFGIFWWFLDPLILMAIYYFLIHMVFGRGGPDFHVFALCGIVCFRFFSRVLTDCTSSLTGNRGLIRQTDLPLFIYILINPVVQTVYCACGIMVIAAFVPANLGVHCLAVLPLVLLLAIFATALGFFLSVFNVYFRDTINFVRYIVRLFFFLSPVLYGSERILNSDRLPEIIKTVYSMNPLVPIITAIRTIFLNGEMYRISTILVLFLFGIFLFQAGLIYFRYNANQTIKML